MSGFNGIHDRFEQPVSENNPFPVTTVDSNGNVNNVQYPQSTNGDSVYCKDVWIEQSDTTNWVDEDGTGLDIVCIPFTNLHTRIKNNTTDNPKTLLVHFNRTVYATQVGLGCIDFPTDSFSNIKIIALGSGGVERVIADQSADNTKYGSRNIFFPKQELFNAIRIEFHTTDPICISNITIQKVNEVSLSQVERTTNSLKVMSYSHAELHSGDHYLYREFHLVAKDGVQDHLIVTPDTPRWAHMTIATDTVTSSIVVELFEDTVTSDDGTLENSRNRNRNFPDNNTTLVYEDPVVVDPGIPLSSSYFGEGRGSPGGGGRDEEEILLKQNTKYLLRVTEQGIVETVVNIVFDWYEHTNKDEPEP